MKFNRGSTQIKRTQSNWIPKRQVVTKESGYGERTKWGGEGHPNPYRPAIAGLKANVKLIWKRTVGNVRKELQKKGLEE